MYENLLALINGDDVNYCDDYYFVDVLINIEPKKTELLRVNHFPKQKFQNYTSSSELCAKDLFLFSKTVELQQRFGEISAIYSPLLLLLPPF